jgi:uncharacterized membrane protein
MIIPAILLLYFLTPLLISYLCYKNKKLNKIGSVILTFIFGIIIGNIFIIPLESNAYRNLLTNRTFIQRNDAIELFQQGVIRHNDLILNQIASIQNLIIVFIIPISISLLLFSFNISSSIIIIKKSFFYIITALISFVTFVSAGFFLFKDLIPGCWKLSGMMMGLISGGSTSIITLSSALDISPNTFVFIQIFNLIIGPLIFMLLISPIKRMSKLINPVEHEGEKTNKRKNPINDEEVNENLTHNFSLKNILPLFCAFGISFLIVSTGFCISSILPIEYQRAITILLIIFLGLLCGLIPLIKKIEKTRELGLYLILVSCLIISSMTDFRTMFQTGFLYSFLYLFIVVVGSILTTSILTVLFYKIPDTTKITFSTFSFFYPFFPFVAGSLKKKEFFVTGITLGAFGYFIGNILGIILAYILKYL